MWSCEDWLSSVPLLPMSTVVVPETSIIGEGEADLCCFGHVALPFAFGIHAHTHTHTHTHTHKTTTSVVLFLKEATRIHFILCWFWFWWSLFGCMNIWIWRAETYFKFGGCIVRKYWNNVPPGLVPQQELYLFLLIINYPAQMEG